MLTGKYFRMTGLTLILVFAFLIIISTVLYGNNFVPKTTHEAIQELTLVIGFLTGVVLRVIGLSI